MSRNKSILFDKEITDMVQCLSKMELKDEICKVDQSITEAQETLSKLLAYKEFLYREAWCRGQREEHENED